MSLGISGERQRRVWVVGAIAWDTVLHIDAYPAPGTYTQGRNRRERPGGSAANVAQGVATSGLEVGFVTVLGRDDLGEVLHETLRRSDLQHLHIRWVDGETNHVLVLVDGAGDRTILGLAGDGLDTIHLDGVPLEPGDIVVFVVWNANLRADLEIAAAAGCITVVGLGALEDPHVAHADIAFGSHVDIAPGTDPRLHLDRFKRIVRTGGADGARQYTTDEVLHQPALLADVVDTTGAGDAFLAGYLSVYAHGLTDGRAALEAGARWAGLMVQLETSIPPHWRTVEGLAALLPTDVANA